MDSILSSNETSVKVELLKYTAQPEETVSLAAKLCYSDSNISDLNESIGAQSQQNFIEKIVGIGHHSVLEHISFTFGIEGVSRALTHQLVRHRIASFSQKSQRYVGHHDGFEYVVPESIRENPAQYLQYTESMAQISKIYDGLKENGIPAEDARYILPNACETKLIMTMNARELLHFFKVRCCNRAQWEIQDMSQQMLEKCIEVAPLIFKQSGPGCVSGPCPEKQMTCGKASEVRQKYHALLEKYDKLN